ncbi:MAG TPA: glycosyltransferase family 87 protein [Bryobacteraceae bacterium]|nr:glycosyltransferase family 87 protein [Bryobacteraceae bacterium]
MRLPNDRIWRYVLILAAVYFVVRGPVRFFTEGGDFLTLFASSRSWLHGENPYTSGSLMASAVAAGASVPAEQFVATPPTYLPTALLVYAPLAALPWSIANGLWFAILLGAFGWAAVMTSRLAGGLTAPLASLLLAFAPVHTAFARGQPSLLVCALVIAGVTIERPLFAGFLLALGMCIKPQLTIGFVVLAAVWKQWAKVLWTFGIGALVAICSVAPMKVDSLRLIASYISALNPVTGIVEGLGFEQLGFHLINIDTLIPPVLHSSLLGEVLDAIILIATMITVLRSSDRKASMAVVASATLLIGYHRFYDAQILWLGLPAALRTAGSRLFPFFAASCTLFLFPGQTIAQRVFENFLDTPWAAILIRHEAITCVGMWAMFLYAARRQERAQPPAS